MLWKWRRRGHYRCRTTRPSASSTVSIEGGLIPRALAPFGRSHTVAATARALHQLRRDPTEFLETAGFLPLVLISGLPWERFLWRSSRCSCRLGWVLAPGSSRSGTGLLCSGSVVEAPGCERPSERPSCTKSSRLLLLRRYGRSGRSVWVTDLGPQVRLLAGASTARVNQR